MDENIIWEDNLQKNFSEANNIIIKVLAKYNLDNDIERSLITHYLAIKNEDEIYFYDGLAVYFNNAYKYDDNLNLQIINRDDEVKDEIKKEKYFPFKEGYLSEKTNQNSTFFMKLPLSKPKNLDEFKKEYRLPKIVLEAKITDQAVEFLFSEEVQKVAVLYDANQVYDKMLETKGNKWFENPEPEEELEIE